MHWKQYESFIKAIVELFHPFVEAAIHDLVTGKIVAIYHNLSRRKIGDRSPLHELKVDIDAFPDHFPSYYKKNWDGRPLKCTSITLRNDDGKPVALICFNVETSFAFDTVKLLESFLKTQAEADNPVELYGTQAEEQVNTLVHDYLREHNLSINHLNHKQKQELVQNLYHKGIFNFKNAAPLLAESMGVTRASIYNYIKKIGKES